MLCTSFYKYNSSQIELQFIISNRLLIRVKTVIYFNFKYISVAKIVFLKLRIKSLYNRNIINKLSFT